MSSSRKVKFSSSSSAPFVGLWEVGSERKQCPGLSMYEMMSYRSSSRLSEVGDTHPTNKT